MCGNPTTHCCMRHCRHKCCRVFGHWRLPSQGKRWMVIRAGSSSRNSQRAWAEHPFHHLPSQHEGWLLLHNHRRKVKVAVGHVWRHSVNTLGFERSMANPMRWGCEHTPLDKANKPTNGPKNTPAPALKTNVWPENYPSRSVWSSDFVGIPRKLSHWMNQPSRLALPPRCQVPAPP